MTNAHKYATTNSIQEPNKVHLKPISLNSTEKVATHGKYRRQKTKNESALAGLKKWTAEVEIRRLD